MAEPDVRGRLDEAVSLRGECSVSGHVARLTGPRHRTVATSTAPGLSEWRYRPVTHP
ncbi:hypothetical protein SAMN05660350_03460 [Geodermatophilus obscurus]|uniref:Uncharacterized protein n=1 Tax=Geodermatophilus obscurus TaxID=1861 RepID=A0A1M7UKV1_9ACTN|nr:hypothetical protein SAMN05660350_03460 [Geodermatophilus obscurus]